MEHGLSLAKYDKHLKHKIMWIKKLPQDSEEAIKYCLKELQIQEKEWESYLSHALTQLPGWTAYIKGRNKLVDYLAVRLATVAILVNDRPLRYSKKDAEKQALFNSSSYSTPKTSEKYRLTRIEMQEKKYREQLIDKLNRSIKKPDKKKKPDAQLVFCIDPRSEPIRRRIEKLGNYETFGFAGFFGLPIRILKGKKEAPINSCPILVEPQHNVFASGSANKRSILKTLYKNLKYQFGTAFALVETAGFYCGLAMIWRMIIPRVAHKWLNRIRHPVQYDLNRIPFEKKVLYAENLLRGIGLTHSFCKRVIFCGHGSCTTNNPFASALDCGACGGNHGGPNAQIAAEILNLQNIREKLSEQGICIPAETTFLSAFHNTTTDHFHFLNHTKEDETLANLKRHLLEAGKENTLSRFNTSNFSTGLKRSKDWSEVQPEQGLAQNASLSPPTGNSLMN